MVGITAQSPNESKAKLELDFDIQVDETNEDAKKYGIFITPKTKSPLADVDGVYPSGMVQPGVVVEIDNGDVLFHWAINPNEMNLGGASDRPLVTDIVSSLGNILQGNQVDGDAMGKTDMGYLEQNHPVTHQAVQAYLDSMK